MGRRANPRNKRRRARNSKRRRVSTPLSAVGIGVLRTLRNFTLYPKQLKSDKPETSFWLDKLAQYGALAMKIFLAAVTYTERIGASLAPYATVQCIAVGPEDLLWSSAIKEVRRIEYMKEGTTNYLSVPCVDYRQARLRQMSVKVTPSSDMAKRGGRVCLAIVPLTLHEAEKIVDGSLAFQQIDFTQLVQMPGAVLAPASRAVSKTWSPRNSDMGHEFRECGDAVTPKDEKHLSKGGLPVALVYFGYQDMAGTKPDASVLYSPEEATFNMDLSGAIDLREYGTSYIRKFPKALFGSDTVGVIHPDNLRPADFPVAGLTVDGSSIVLEDAFVPQAMRDALRAPASTSISSKMSILGV